MYIDSHQHFWKLSRGDYSWMTPDMKELYKDFFPEDLEPLIKEKNITQTVIVQAADTIEETEFTLSLASKYDFIAGVVGWVDLDSDKAR
jgi:L-fuconolactonase